MQCLLIPFALALLFFFTWDLFEDERKPPLLVWIIAAFYVVVALWIGIERCANDTAVNIYIMAPVQLTKLGLAVGAIFIVWRGRENDVVESRLKLRLNPTFVLRDASPSAPVSPEETPLVDALNKLMSEDFAYTNHDLRIAELAASLRVPEYQLRRTINRNLGYQNFNQFVNRYRVEEAARRLVNEPRAPVLTIALDVGFRSISSFNTAFRAQYQKTPTDYRKSKLADS